MRRVLLFIILSVCFHLLSWTTSEYLGLYFKNFQNNTPHSDPIEVSLEENQQKSMANQIVRQADIPKEQQAIDDTKAKADLFSEKDQRVKVQSKAALFGLTKNRLYEAQKKSLKQKLTSEPNKDKLNSKNNLKKPISDDSILNDFKQRTRQDSISFDSIQDAPSTVGELLPDSINVGNFTALNTDRHLFYSFYSRVEEAIRYKWEHDVEITISNLNRNQYHNPNSIWNTRLDIILTRDGKFYKALLLKESGIRGLDFAAINAFREANFFPHPPKEMIGEDGFIRLQYQFHVFYDPARGNPQQLNL